MFLQSVGRHIKSQDCTMQQPEGPSKVETYHFGVYGTQKTPFSVTIFMIVYCKCSAKLPNSVVHIHKHGSSNDAQCSYKKEGNTLCRGTKNRPDSIQ
jgi:hypothetical protein